MAATLFLVGGPSAIPERVELFDIAQITTGLFRHKDSQRDFKCPIARGIEPARRQRPQDLFCRSTLRVGGLGASGHQNLW